MKKAKVRGGEIPGTQWPEPDMSNPDASQAVVFASKPRECIIYGNCPRCGR